MSGQGSGQWLGSLGKARGNSVPLGVPIAMSLRMTKGVRKLRTWRESPLYNRLLPIYLDTRVGAFSKRLSDMSHHRWWIAWEWIAYKLTIYRNRRRVGLFLATMGAFSFGLFDSHKGRNYYTIGFDQGMTQMADYSKNVLMGMGSDNKKKYYL